MQKLLLLLLFIPLRQAFAQTYPYTTANAHSHNDYEQPIPFEAAYHEGFGSIEADVHLRNDTLYVAHEKIQPGPKHTLESLYLQPLNNYVQLNNGFPYADHKRSLQLLIDVKTDSITTLQKIVSTIQHYPALTSNTHIRFVISGNRPDPSTFAQYPAFISFDGNIGQSYPATALSKIAMMSADLHRFTSWNGKSNLPAAEQALLKQLVDQTHASGKTIRFWNSPDAVNAWFQLMKLNIDYLNTDHIPEISTFLRQLPATTFRNDTPYPLYQPTYKTDGTNKPVKNIILLIGDGTGLPQLYAGYTANHAGLNIFRMHQVGLSKTSSFDSYITDSAPGSTSISSGQKTCNRFVGVDHTGHPIPLIPNLIRAKGMVTGLITSGDVTDATPADFYAHRNARDSSAAIFSDLASAPIQLLMGSGNPAFNPTLAQTLRTAGFHITTTLDSIPAGSSAKWLVMEPKAGLPASQGRGPWLQQALNKTLHLLAQNKSGFFIMAEGAQIDYGGHANNLPYVATEVMDFDQLVGKALQFADENGETLVVVTADHETGGLTLLDGDYTSGTVGGHFSTNDHTALPVPVFAYGPQSQHFTGMYENTDLFSKLLSALGITPPSK